MKRKRTLRGHRARRKINSQSKEGGRGRRLLRFHRQAGVVGVILPLTDAEIQADPPKKAA